MKQTQKALMYKNKNLEVKAINWTVNGEAVDVRFLRSNPPEMVFSKHIFGGSTSVSSDSASLASITIISARHIEPNQLKQTKQIDKRTKKRLRKLLVPQTKNRTP